LLVVVVGRGVGVCLLFDFHLKIGYIHIYLHGGESIGNGLKILWWYYH